MTFCASSSVAGCGAIGKPGRAAGATACDCDEEGCGWGGAEPLCATAIPEQNRITSNIGEVFMAREYSSGAAGHDVSFACFAQPSCPLWFAFTPWTTHPPRGFRLS